ncbi:hypothetical protein Tco_0197216 [Tanacetum coccineum]
MAPPLASANVPAIYLQQFWKTMSYNEKTGVYSCQVNEQWFDLSADLLRKALAITPVNPTHPFELPPSGDTKTPQGSASMQPATKRATPKKPTTTTPVKQSKPAHSLTKKPFKRKPTFQLVDEDDEAQQESIPHEEEKGEGEGDDADLERAIKLSLDPAFLSHPQTGPGRNTCPEA